MTEGTRVLLSEETGEYITTLHPGDRVVRKKIIDNLPENPGKMPFSNGEWGKAYNESLKKLARLPLSASDYKVIIFLLPMVRIGSGLVAYGNYRPAKLDWLADQLKMDRKTIQRSMKRLADFRIISAGYSGRETIYFFNPYIFQRGRYINKTLFDMFRKSEWAKRKTS